MLKTSDRIALAGVIVAGIAAIASFGQWLAPRIPEEIEPEATITNSNEQRISTDAQGIDAVTASAATTQAQTTSVPVSSSMSPVIDDVVLRIEGSGNDKLLHQDIYFHDEDGNSYIVVYELRSSTRAGIKVENDPITASSDLQKAGTFVTGTWQCETTGYIVVLRATILDSQGNSSAPKNIDFDCR